MFGFGFVTPRWSGGEIKTMRVMELMTIRRRSLVLMRTHVINFLITNMRVCVCACVCDEVHVNQ